jgi:DNA-binding NarL/FixJ family response regulator
MKTRKTRTPTALKRRILIVDEHPTVRDRLAAIIDAEADLTVCGVVDKGEAILLSVKRRKPDLVIMEVIGRGGNRFDHLRSLRAANPKVPVLVCSGGPCSAISLEAMRAGASGFVCKTSPIVDLLRTIRTVLRGEPWLCHTMTSNLVRKVSLGFADSELPPVGRLSGREKKVFELLGQGEDPAGIAKHLHLTVPVVEVCCEQLKTKLDLSGTRELSCAASRWVDSRA